MDEEAGCSREKTDAGLLAEHEEQRKAYGDRASSFPFFKALRDSERDSERERRDRAQSFYDTGG